MSRAIFEQCIQFVSELEQQESEIDIATKMNMTVDDDHVALLVIQKLQHAIQYVLNEDETGNQTKLLYHIAVYANAIGKPRRGVPLCYIVINHPDTASRYKELAEVLLTELRLKLPKDMYTEELEKTTLDIHAALGVAQQWLAEYERHAAQPATKHVFNADLIKQQFRNSQNKP